MLAKTNSSPEAEPPVPAGVVGALVVLVVAGFLLRAHGIADQSLSHPEIYIPGIALSPETITPPPRFGFIETLSWHFHKEPHPIGYHMALLGWTSVFGDSQTALRLPSVLSGTASILLIYWLTAGLFGRRAGVIAAALMTFHGFLVFWSGMARMYAPGLFFALLSTLLLTRLASGQGGAWSKAGYVFALVAGVETTELNWAILAVHVGWTALFAAPAPKERPSLAILQTIAFFLAAPGLIHAAYLALGAAAAPPSLKFLAHYFSFGFMFEPDEFSDPERTVSLIAVGAGLVLSLLLAAIGAARPALARVRPPSGGVRFSVLAGGAAVSAATMVALASIAERRAGMLYPLSVLPLAALAFPPVAAGARLFVKRASPPVGRLLDRIDPFVALLLLLGVIAPLGIFAVSLWKPVTVFRAFIVFVPFYLVLIAAGLSRLSVRPPVFGAASLATALLLAVSLAHEAGRPATPRDYKGIAAAISARLADGDLIFIRRYSWMDAPVTYYLPHDRIVGVGFAKRIAARGADRVWTIRWGDHEMGKSDENIAAALADFVRCDKVEARRATAFLYVRRTVAPARCQGGGDR